MGTRFSRPSEIFSIVRWNGKMTWARLLMRNWLFTSMPSRFERGDFLEQSSRVDDHAVADDGQNPRPQNAARNQLQNEFRFADVNRVAGVVAALIARDGVEIFRRTGRRFCLCLRRPTVPREQ